MKIQNAHGDWETAQAKISEVAVNLFKNLFATDHGNVNMDVIFRDIDLSKLSESDIATLSREFDLSEIWTALKQMHHTKAPRPDDYHAIFFKKQ